MNVFLLSPGRTGTLTLSRAFGILDGYSSGHESRANLLGDERIAYPMNHVECDGRLSWFLPRLTKQFGDQGVFVIVRRDQEAIARSYDQRWHQIFMMKAYSQGILLRDLKDNSTDVCRDYVHNVYEHLEYFSEGWQHVVELDIENPEKGLKAVLEIMGRPDDLDRMLAYLREKRHNKNEPAWSRKLKALYFNTRNLFVDLIYN